MNDDFTHIFNSLKFFLPSCLLDLSPSRTEGPAEFGFGSARTDHAMSSTNAGKSLFLNERINQTARSC